MQLSRWLIVAILASASSFALPNAKLQAAKKQIDSLEFEGAAKLLSEAAEVTGNERAVVLEILELQGIVWGSLGGTDMARNAFRALLLLNPTYTLPRGQSPRVRAPFNLAKEQTAASGLVLEADVQRGSQVIEALAVRVKNNVPSLGQVVAFHLAVGGEARTERVKLDKEGRASVKVGAKRVKWWAELLGARDAVLMHLGDATHPMEEEAPDLVEPPPAPLVTEPSSPPPSGWVRPLGITLLASGAVAVGIGVVLGAQAEDARNKLKAVLQDGAVTTSLTQREAAKLNAQAQTFAPVANVLLFASAALAGTGLGLTIAGGTPDVAVTIAPAPGGAALWGHF